MSDPHHPHGPEPREFSHPVLWTVGLVVAVLGLAWVFFTQLAHGREVLKGAPKLVVQTAAAGEPDHAALIADRSQPVLDRGEILYGKNCASCHGPQGDTNPTGVNPPVRNLKLEAFKNPLGAGPYGFYQVLTKGYAGMPAFRNLPVADRYAITHFVRESWMKSGPNYVAEDADAVKAQVPAKGAAGAAATGRTVDPTTITPPPTIYPLMAAMVSAHAPEQAQVSAWLAAAGSDPVCEAVRELHAAQPRVVERLLRACVSDDEATFTAVITAPSLAGTPAGHLAVMPRPALHQGFAALSAAAHAITPVGGAK